jgi:hypothetical protein
MSLLTLLRRFDDALECVFDDDDDDCDETLECVLDNDDDDFDDARE